jgi:hypothetical protein
MLSSGAEISATWQGNTGLQHDVRGEDTAEAREEGGEGRQGWRRARVPSSLKAAKNKKISNYGFLYNRKAF